MATRKQANSLVRLNVAGKDCEIDMEKLTLGEIAEVERYFDKPIADLNRSDWGSTRGTIILATLARRRVDPDWNLAETEGLQVDGIAEVAERPTKAKTPATSGSQS